MHGQALGGQRNLARARPAAGAVQAVARKVVQQGQGAEGVPARGDGRLAVLRVRQQQAALRGQEPQRARRHGLHGDGALLVGRRDRQGELQGDLLPVVARHEARLLVLAARLLVLAARALLGPEHGAMAMARVFGLNTGTLEWFEMPLWLGPPRVF